MGGREGVLSLISPKTGVGSSLSRTPVFYNRINDFE